MFLLLNRIQLMEGEGFFSANGSPAYFAETLPTVSCVTVGSSLCA